MNIVFDLGGVVFRWDPDAILAEYFPVGEERELVDALVFRHRDWAEMDRGALTYEEAARRGAERTGLDETRLRRFLDGVGPHLIPMEKSTALLREVKAAGHGLYLLSNMHEPAVSWLEKYNFMKLFDGKIYSCLVGQVKPARDIFQTLLNRFALEPRDTLFIDDTPGNLVEPAALGLGTILFTGADQCRSDLISRGVSI